MIPAHIEHIVRTQIVQTCRRLQDEGLVVGTAGNVSVRLDDGILITPSATAYETMDEDDICAVADDGRAIDPPQSPSSELGLHLAAYAASPSANAVVHFHGRWSCAAAACIADALPIIHYYAARLDAPVAVVPYAHFGSPELAASVGGALTTRRAVLMANHGATVTGRTLKEAFENARLLEWLCRLHIDSGASGKRLVLSDADAGVVAETYARRESKGRSR
ncbi:MAG: class II aldolase/adducin family protein [Microbacteriaceae bacterium]|nr:MAG: class II aldolase/adducin family protein [Microbacteriaceae bacterium]